MTSFGNMCFMFHHWSMWHCIDVNQWENNKIVALKSAQYRRCDRCGESQRKYF